MGKYSKENTIHMVEEEDVEFTRLQFTGTPGVLKNIAVTSSQLNKALENHCMFDGSVTEGFVRIDESDVYLYPDLDTFEIFPQRPQWGRVAGLICGVYNPDGTVPTGDPRNVLKWAVEKARDMGFVFNVGPEYKFFLLHTDREGRPIINTHETTGYFDVPPIDLAENVYGDIVPNLGEMDFEMETNHREITPAQHETDLQYTDALCAADNIMTFKMTAKTITKRHGLRTTFMPESKEGINGSGMHTNMSPPDMLGKDLFVDDADALGLSATAYYFATGILHHMKSMTILTNPFVDSYKRLIPGYGAPIYIVWSPTSDHNSPICIPSPRGGNTRIELCCPDSAMNLYLALAACLRAGLDGIEKKMALPACVEGNMFIMKPEEVGPRNVERVLETLGDAIEAYEGDSFIKGVPGERIYARYLEAKEKGWRNLRTQVTDWEVSEYLYRYRLLVPGGQGTWR